MPALRVPPKEAIRRLTERIEAMPAAGGGSAPGYYDVVSWCSKTWPVIDAVYGPGDLHAEEIRTIGLSACSCSAEGEASELLALYRSRLLAYIDEIRTGEDPDR